MSNLRKVAAQKARKYGLDPSLFVRQINTESGFNPHAVSGAGARGVAQIMPGTAAGWHVNPDQPVAALDAAAKHMAEYVKTGGSYRNALVLYNLGHLAPDNQLPAETRNYVRTILGGGAGQSKLNPKSTLDFQRVELGKKTVADPAAFHQAQAEFALDRLLTLHHGPQGTVMQRVGLLPTTAPNPSDFTTQQTTSKIVHDQVPAPGGGGRTGRVAVASGADRAGVGVQPIVKEFVGRVAGIAGTGITITTGTNHNRLTVNGNVSDHWDGHAADIAVPVDSARGDRIAAAGLVAAGVSPKRALKMAKQGGLFTINHGGHRIQVIWKTYEGGNHHNHVHIGIR